MDLQVENSAPSGTLEAPARITGKARRGTPVSTNICIIEDDDDIRDALADLLDSVGYKVISYASAELALLELPALAPDLILLDLMMPGMNGWQFRIEQKRRAKLCEIPVIVLSADVSPYAAAIDADAYLPKPLDFDQLEALIEQVLLITERKRLMARSVELERVRSLGLLTASVAHEINNPLAYLIGCLDLAQNEAREQIERPISTAVQKQKLYANIVAASDGAERVSSIVRLLSTFSRPDDGSDSEIDPVRAVRAAVRLAQHQIEARARLVTALHAVPNVVGNEGRLSQVVLNLLINAVHALPPDKQRAEIRVSTRQDGDAVLVEVTDNGAGIEPELLDRIFQPFFTTKPPGMGTGLGLSISREIVIGMGGTLSVVSQLGAGATFCIRVPATALTSKRSDPSKEAERTFTKAKSHSEAAAKELALRLVLASFCSRADPRASTFRVEASRDTTHTS
jgi:signal transduction histidine kinase